MKLKDLSGMRFGSLVVLGVHGKNNSGAYCWDCLCDCGKTCVAIGNEMSRGRKKHCGCMTVMKDPPDTTKHGMSRSKLYHIWIAMKQRCNNPNDRNYARYGGRGITVCSEWEQFEPFMRWAFENGYVEGKVDLDREDNDKGYSPENCRFITHQKNLLNTHRKLHDVIRGEDITLRDAADKYGLRYGLLYQRYKHGKRGEDLIADVQH